MKIIGADYLERLEQTENFTGKMVFNDQGAFIFSVQSQHRDMKASGISYDHDGRETESTTTLYNFSDSFNGHHVLL